ncbi:hypothetical protein CC78DRAFT_583613 [Lojkania enalia]|uniref:Uncharacterized protein n=1 Tax=Lojkania enalia TaxID=147567 RepID=A0A9P4K5W5_9PLEO|nr:hypothetical protein CC78DRAFT_583613 [Didymosphaeria enalia]
MEGDAVAAGDVMLAGRERKRPRNRKEFIHLGHTVGGTSWGLTRDGVGVDGLKQEARDAHRRQFVGKYRIPNLLSSLGERESAKVQEAQAYTSPEAQLVAMPLRDGQRNNLALERVNPRGFGPDGLERIQKPAPSLGSFGSLAPPNLWPPNNLVPRTTTGVAAASTTGTDVEAFHGTGVRGQRRGKQGVLVAGSESRLPGLHLKFPSSSSSVLPAIPSTTSLTSQHPPTAPSHPAVCLPPAGVRDPLLYLAASCSLTSASTWSSAEAEGAVGPAICTRALVPRA